MSDNSQPSSARSLANSAVGTVQEGIASVTGNPADTRQAEQTKSKHPT